jgi:hypothetical protein
LSNLSQVHEVVPYRKERQRIALRAIMRQIVNREMAWHGRDRQRRE